MAGEGTFVLKGVRVFGMMTLSNLETYVNGRFFGKGILQKMDPSLVKLIIFLLRKAFQVLVTLCRNETEEAEHDDDFSTRDLFQIKGVHEISGPKNLLGSKESKSGSYVEISNLGGLRILRMLHQKPWPKRNKPPSFM